MLKLLIFNSPSTSNLCLLNPIYSFEKAEFFTKLAGPGKTRSSKKKDCWKSRTWTNSEAISQGLKNKEEKCR